MITPLMSPQDLDWIFDVHLRAFSDRRATTAVAMLYGKEDWPTMVDLHDVDHYAAPFRRYVADEDGILQFLGILTDVTRADNRTIAPRKDNES